MNRAPLRPGIYAALVLRDGPVCYIDGQPAADDDPLEIEHVRPVALGGGNDLRNLRLAHRSCNRWKAARRFEGLEQ